MKGKATAALLVIAMVVYLLLGFKYSHQQWKKGIPEEERVKGEMLIW